MKLLKITTVGTSTTSGAASSAAIAIPNSASGGRAKFVRVIGSTLGHIKFGSSGVVATVSDILVSSNPDYYDVGGCTHYAVIERTAACVINVVPVDM